MMKIVRRTLADALRNSVQPRSSQTSEFLGPSTVRSDGVRATVDLMQGGYGVVDDRFAQDDLGIASSHNSFPVELGDDEQGVLQSWHVQLRNTNASTPADGVVDLRIDTGVPGIGEIIIAQVDVANLEPGGSVTKFISANMADLNLSGVTREFIVSGGFGLGVGQRMPAGSSLHYVDEWNTTVQTVVSVWVASVPDRTYLAR